MDRACVATSGANGASFRTGDGRSNGGDIRLQVALAIFVDDNKLAAFLDVPEGPAVA